MHYHDVFYACNLSYYFIQTQTSMNVRQTMVVALLLLIVKMCQEHSIVNVLLDMNSKREKTALVRHLCVYILKLVKNRLKNAMQS